MSRGTGGEGRGGEGRALRLDTTLPCEAARLKNGVEICVGDVADTTQRAQAKLVHHIHDCSDMIVVAPTRASAQSTCCPIQMSPTCSPDLDPNTLPIGMQSHFSCVGCAHAMGHSTKHEHTQLHLVGAAPLRSTWQIVYTPTTMCQTTETGPNPWLSIPPEDYEGHMSSPSVRQWQLLSRVLAERLAVYKPRSLAILGCATGNGLEHVDPETVQRLLGIDINPDYLNVARARHIERLPQLELVCGDLTTCNLDADSLEFVYTGLLFEYIDPAILLPRIAKWLIPTGVLVVVLQRPTATALDITNTPYTSLKALAPSMNLIDPLAFRRMAAQAGLRETEAWTRMLETGKSFFVGTYAHKDQ